MPRWAVILIVAPLALCVTCVGVVYFVVLPKSRTDVKESSDLMGTFLPGEGFAEGLENGINRALDEHGLAPTAITLRTGVMTIRTERVSRAGVASRVDGDLDLDLRAHHVPGRAARSGTGAAP